MMSYRARVRLLFVLAGCALVTSVLACGTPTQRGPGGQQGRSDVQIVRRGGDVLGAGETVRIADSVPGDAMLAGGQLSFSGATGGDYLGAGGSQVITGRIHGSARVAGGEIRVAGPIERNATIAGGTVELDRDGVVGRNAYFAGGTIRIDGTVRQGLHVSGGTVALDGQAGGDVEVNAGELRVGPGATIAGNLRYRVPAERVRIDSGAHIAGRVTALPPQEMGGVVRYIRTLWLLGFLVAGGVAVALAPRFADEAAERMRERPGLAALVGVSWIIVIPIAALLVAVTVIGLPLAILSGALYVVVLYLGRAVLAVWLGRLVARALGRTMVPEPLMSFLIGAIILIVIELLPVIGSLVMLVATVFGLGALLVEIRAWSRAPAMR